MRMYAASALLAMGLAGLAGCTQAADAPLPKPTSKTSLAPVQATPEPESQTCLEFAAETQSSRPAQGSDEWKQMVTSTYVPYVAGEASEDVLADYANKTLEWSLAAVQDLPEDMGTIQNCLEEVKRATEDSTDMSTNAEALNALLGLDWRSGVYGEALMRSGAEGTAQGTADRNYTMIETAYRVLLHRIGNQNPTLGADYTVDNIVTDASPENTTSGTFTITAHVGSNSVAIHNGAVLNVSRENPHWENVATYVRN